MDPEIQVTPVGNLHSLGTKFIPKWNTSTTSETFKRFNEFESIFTESE